MSSVLLARWLAAASGDGSGGSSANMGKGAVEYALPLTESIPWCGAEAVYLPKWQTSLVVKGAFTLCTQWPR